MDVEKIIRAIQRCNDVSALNQIKKAVYKRSDTVVQRNYKMTVGAAWDRVRNLQPGAVLYCCSAGTFLGGPFQRGDQMTVHSLQSRVKRLWVTSKKDAKLYWFGPQGVERYNLQVEPPAQPLSESERKLAEAVSKVGKGPGDAKCGVSAAGK